jgi:hypothetical protein
MKEGVLLLIVAPDLEETMIDLLLEQPSLAGFTSSLVYAHGTGAGRLSMVEQVTGRQQKIQLMVYGTRTVLTDLVTHIKATLPHADIRTILIPALDTQLME